MRSRPYSLAEILARCADLGPLQRSLAKQQALLEQVRKALPSPLGEHCLWAGLTGNRLLLFADSPAWGTRLRYLAPGLLAALRHAGTAVKDLRVRVLPSIDPPRKAPRRPVTLSSANACLLHQVAEDIGDPALRDALRRLARRGG